MEFDGQLSLTDIFNLTYKELDILREHRRKYGKNYRANKEIMNMMGGAGLVANAVQQAQAPQTPQPQTLPPIPGKFNTNLSQ